MAFWDFLAALASFVGRYNSMFTSPHETDTAGLPSQNQSVGPSYLLFRGAVAVGETIPLVRVGCIRLVRG
jgi:hypothetical protein